MCTNFRLPDPASFPACLGALAPTFDYPPEAWPMYEVPMLVAGPEDGLLLPRRAMFGLVPPWAKDAKFARRTYNARSETVAELPSYRRPWRLRQFCLVPTTGFYEPNYEGGKAVRWLIRRVDGEPFALAGIWEARRDEQGLVQHSFSMLTINADEHPLMRRFHAPGDEKRSVAIISPVDYAVWLGAKTDEEARSLLKPFPADAFTALAAPRPPRKTSTA